MVLRLGFKAAPNVDDPRAGGKSWQHGAERHQMHIRSYASACRLTVSR
jgi:hypothetical protein